MACRKAAAYSDPPGRRGGLGGYRHLLLSHPRAADSRAQPAGSDHARARVSPILETNGILIGHDRSYAVDLGRFPNLYVRVCVKGACEENFSRLTGAPPEGFGLQLAALQYLERAGVDVQAAVMVSFSTGGNLARQRSRLAAIAPRFADFEVDELVLYGEVAKRLTAAVPNRLRASPHPQRTNLGKFRFTCLFAGEKAEKSEEDIKSLRFLRPLR